MQKITKRFLETYKSLAEQQKFSSAAEFCSIIDISTSMMTEIKKGRSEVGLSAIQNTVINFPEINAEWLLTGQKGQKQHPDMVKEEESPYKSERIEELKTALMDKERIIKMLEAEISRLKAAMKGKQS